MPFHSIRVVASIAFCQKTLFLFFPSLTCRISVIWIFFWTIWAGHDWEKSLCPCCQGGITLWWGKDFIDELRDAFIHSFIHPSFIHSKAKWKSRSCLKGCLHIILAHSSKLERGSTNDSEWSTHPCFTNKTKQTREELDWVWELTLAGTLVSGRV